MYTARRADGKQEADGETGEAQPRVDDQRDASEKEKKRAPEAAVNIHEYTHRLGSQFARRSGPRLHAIYR